MTWHVCMPTKLLKQGVKGDEDAHYASSILRPGLRAFFVDGLAKLLMIVVLVSDYFPGSTGHLL